MAPTPDLTPDTIERLDRINLTVEARWAAEANRDPELEWATLDRLDPDSRGEAPS